MHPSSFSDYYKRGIAIGVPDIRNDQLIFFYRGRNGMEEYSVPSAAMLAHPQLAKSNGVHYTAKIKDVRKAAKER